MGTVVYSHRRPHKGIWTGARARPQTEVCGGQQRELRLEELEPGCGGPRMPQGLLPNGSEVSQLVLGMVAAV